MKPHELNYPTHDLELVVIIHALELWRHYLYEEEFEVFTNHKSLQYLLSQRELNNQQHCWLKYLSDYNCTIQYHLGKSNLVADALSRKMSAKLNVMVAFECKLLEEFSQMNLRVQVKRS